MAEPRTEGAWGYGLATLSEPGDRVLDTLVPEPQLGTDTPGAAGTRILEGDDAPARAGRGHGAATSAAACVPSQC